MTFSIPLVPPSGNRWTRMHWAERKRLVEDWYLLVSAACPRETFERARVEAVFYFPENRRRDLMNFAPVLDKLVIDHLVHLGVLPDDDAKHLPEFSIRFEIDPDNPRTEVTLTSF